MLIKNIESHPQIDLEKLDTKFKLNFQTKNVLTTSLKT